MLPKKERLSRQAFSRFFSAGRRMHTPLFQLIYTPYPTLHASVVVSKKIAKNAVDRNKIRRRVYDITRRYRSENGFSGVYIFIMKSGAEQSSYQDLRETVQGIITKTLSN